MQESSLKISSKNISETLYKYHNKLLPEFYEMQSNFLTLRYNWTKNIEVSNILTFLVMSTHLSILRKRERNLDYNVSFNNLNYGLIEGTTWFNYLPKRPGSENIEYSVKDSFNETRFGNIMITIVQAPSYSSDIISKITNLKDYLLTISILKSHTVLMLIGWFLFSLITISFLIFHILSINIFTSKKLNSFTNKYFIHSK